MKIRFFPFKRFLIGVGGVLMLALAGIAAGDVVYLKNGGSFEGKVTEQNGRVLIELRNGSIEFRESDVERIEKKPLPEEIFGGRLKEAGNDADACVEVARWAKEKDLEKEYVQALRTALLIDKNHKEAKELFRSYKLHHASLPANDDACEKILRDMGDGFQVLRTKHYRICYNSADIFAEITGERLEQLFEEFMAFFEDRHFEPAPLTDRLEVVLFDTAEEYYRYAKKMAKEITYSEGFYSGKTGRSYFYDALSDNANQFQNTRNEISQQLQKVKQQQREVTDALRKGSQQYVITEQDGSQRKVTGQELLDELRKHTRALNTEYEKIRTFYTNQNVSITIHEGTHQLAYTCGIHSRYFETPVWLLEGVAVYFEAPEEGQWDRPGLVNRKRLEAFVNADNPLRLKELITNDSLFYQNPSKSGTTSAYSTTWALFFYLVEEEHENLFDYIYDLALRINDKSYMAEDRINDFEKYFGDWQDLERSWHHFMRQLALREGIQAGT